MARQQSIIQITMIHYFAHARVYKRAHASSTLYVRYVGYINRCQNEKTHTCPFLYQLKKNTQHKSNWNFFLRLFEKIESRRKLKLLHRIFTHSLVLWTSWTRMKIIYSWLFLWRNPHELNDRTGTDTTCHLYGTVGERKNVANENISNFERRNFVYEALSARISLAM